MGRPRKPTNLLELNGAFKKNPQRGRARANEPVPASGIGAAPAHLGPDEAAAWDEVVDITPPGVLGCSDRIAVEIIAVILATYRRDAEGISSARLRILNSLLGRLGLNPAARSQLAVPAPGRPNPFGGF